MTRVVVGGPELDDFPQPTPASSVRLLLPRDGRLVVPVWEGNEFLDPDGSRPNIRTLTPRRYLADRSELHVDIVHHDGGALTPWAERCLAGERADVAVSGPGRGFEVDTTAASYRLLGDETAIPAICQLLEHLPDVPISVDIGVRHRNAVVDLHRDVDERWHETSSIGDLGRQLVASLEPSKLEGAVIWAAGEATAMQAVRSHLFGELGLARSVATVRGYWKHRDS